MRLRASLLRKTLNVRAVLAMTATATTTTLDAIMSALDIPHSNLIQKAHFRDNFHLSVSMVRNRQVIRFYIVLELVYFHCLNFVKLMFEFFEHIRMKDLLIMIKSPPFAEVQSIIIYCKFQVCIWTGFCPFLSTGCPMIS